MSIEEILVEDSESPRFLSDPITKYKKNEDGSWSKQNITTDECYYVNLATRVIAAPDCLSVEKDHRAENIYFKVDRFYNQLDLATLDCIIQYENAGGTQSVYCVPGYELRQIWNDDRTIKENYLLFAWPISGLVTKKAGKVKFSMMFYRLRKNYDGAGELTSIEFDYKLNTKTSISSIQYGMDVFDSIESEDPDTPPSEYQFTPGVVESMWSEIRKAQSAQQTYWYDV